MGRIPERVSEAVRVIREDGLGHAAVLRRFHDADERRAAAAILSTKLDLGCRHTCNFLHALLITLMLIVAAMRIFDMPPLGIALVGVAILIHRRQVWGYNGMVLLAVWAVVDALLGLGESRELLRSEAIIAIALTAGMIVAGALAVYLRRAMYPYLGLFGIRTDAEGTPALLHALGDSERDPVEP